MNRKHLRLARGRFRPMLSLGFAFATAASAPAAGDSGGGMGVSVFGLQHVGLNGVNFASSIDGSLIVAGLSNPGAELLVNLTQATNFEFVPTFPDLPVGATITMEKRGSIQGAPVQPLTRLDWTYSQEWIAIMPHFDGLGTSTYQVEVWNNNELVTILTGLSGPIIQHTPQLMVAAATAKPQCERLFKRCRVDACAKWGIWWNPSDDIDFTFGDFTVSADLIVIEPRTPDGGEIAIVDYVSQFSLRTSGIAEMNIYSEAIRAGGVAFEALGAAQLNAINGQQIIAAPIGGTGQDGVEIVLESGWDGTRWADVALDSISLPPGSQFTITGPGWIVAPPAGSVQCSGEAAGTRVRVDFSNVGATLAQLELWRAGQLVRSYDLGNGNVALVRPMPGLSLPPIVQCGASSPILNPGDFILYHLQWAGDTQVDAGGQTTVADELRVRPLNATIPMTQIDRLSLTGRNLPSISVLNVDLPEPFPGDLNCDGLVSISDIGPFVLALTDPAGYATQFPDCLASNADINQDGQITVSDIGGFVALLTQ